MSAPSKVTFSLPGGGGSAKSRKKKSSASEPSATKSSLDFGDDHEERERLDKLAASRRALDGGGPLVIPLPATASDRKGPLLSRLRVIDKVESEAGREERDVEGGKGGTECACGGEGKAHASVEDSNGGGIGDGDGDGSVRGGKGAGDAALRDSERSGGPSIKYENDNSGGDVGGGIVGEAEAEAALVRSAVESSWSTSQADGGTNFSASGALVIEGAAAAASGGQSGSSLSRRVGASRAAAASSSAADASLDPQDEFRKDLERLPDDLRVDSDAYAAVPVSEFGAAMLRGMGWKGDNDASGAKNGRGEGEDGGIRKPRHHRLGLGATPKPMALSGKGGGGGGGGGGRHRARRPGQRDVRAEQEKEEEAWRIKAEEKARRDVQRTLQVGSVVRVRGEDGGDRSEEVGARGAEGARAEVVKTSGVPGLNRILVRYERSREDLSVKKGDAVLVDREELDREPFQRASDGGDARTWDKQNGTDASKVVNAGPVRGGGDAREETSIDPFRTRSRSGDGLRRRDGSPRDRYEREGESRRGTERSSREDHPEQRRSPNRGKGRKRRRSHSRSRSRERDRTGDREGHSRGYDWYSSRSRSRSRDRDRNGRRKGRDSRRGREGGNRHKEDGRRLDPDERRRGKEERHRSERSRERRRGDDRSHRVRTRDRGERDDGERADDRQKQRDRDKMRKVDHGRSASKRFEEEETQKWLVPHIRVRVVSNRVDGGRRYKQKGVVVDVLDGGRSASLQMDADGALLEVVSERNLETALPHAGGYVAILIGRHRGAIGRLLERDSSSSKGTVQLLEDMDVVTLSLDDMAEWCSQVED